MAVTFTYEERNIKDATPNAYTYHSYVANIYSISQLNAEMSNSIGGTGVCAYLAEGGSKTELNVPDRKLYTDIVYVENIAGFEKNVYTEENAPTVSCLKDVNIQDFYIDVTLTDNNKVTIDEVDYYSEIYFTFRDRETKSALENPPNLVLRTYDAYTGKYVFRQLPVFPNRQSDSTCSFFGEHSYSLYPSEFINMNNLYGQSFYPNDGVDYFPTIPAIPFATEAFQWYDYTNYVFPYADGLAMRFYTGDRYFSNRAFRPNYSKEEILRFVAVLGLYFEFEGTMYLGYMDSSGQTTGEYLTADEWNKSAQWNSTTINNFKEHSGSSPGPEKDKTLADQKLNPYALNERMLRRYVFDLQQMIDIKTALDGETLSEMDAMQYVVDLSIIPDGLERYLNESDVTSIRLGKIDVALPGKIVTGATSIITLGSTPVTEEYGNFLDYEPYTNLTLYVPFCGKISLPTDKVMGKEISVNLLYDYMNGNLTACVYVGNSLVATSDGNGYCSVPLSQDVSVQKTQSQQLAVIGGVLGIASSVALGTSLGNPALAVIGSVEAARSVSKQGLDIMKKSDTEIIKGSGNITMFNMPMSCCLYYERPDINKEVLNNMGSICGYACNEKGTLSDFSGFTSCSEFHVDKIVCTKTEKEMIAAFLEKGVIL